MPERRRGRVYEYAPPLRAASPMQRRGTSRAWRGAGTVDFLRQLRRRTETGGAYALTGDHERADIIVRTMEDDGWISLWTYPELGLRAMREAGLLTAEEVPEIPGFDLDGYGERSRLGTDLRVWRLSVPERVAAGFAPLPQGRTASAVPGDVEPEEVSGRGLQGDSLHGGS